MWQILSTRMRTVPRSGILRAIYLKSAAGLELLAYAGLQFGGVDAHANAAGLYGYGDGQVFCFGFHTQVYEAKDAAALDGFGDEVGGSAYSP
jgi:hypothetical protein